METLKDYLEYLRSNKKCISIAFSNRKGGVGKTSASMSFAKILADNGYNVLCVDADPQQSMTNILGVNNAYENNPIINFKNINNESKRFREKGIGNNYYVDDLLGESTELENFRSKYQGFHTLIETVINNKPVTKELLNKCIIRPKMIVPKLDEIANNDRAITLDDIDEEGIAFVEQDGYMFDLLPASEEMTDDEVSLVSMKDKINIVDIFGKIFSAIKSECEYDVIICDTPPSLGIFSINAIRAADGCVIVGMPDKQSVYSLAKIKKNIRELKDHNPDKGGIIGFVLNAAKDTDMLKPIMEHYVKEELHIKFFDTLVPKRVSAQKAASTGLTYVQLDKEAKQAYDTLTLEIMQSYFDMVGWNVEKEKFIMEETKKILSDPNESKKCLNKAIANLDARKQKPIETTFADFVKQYGNEEANKLLLPEISKVAREIIREKIKTGDLEEPKRPAKYHAKII